MVRVATSRMLTHWFSRFRIFVPMFMVVSASLFAGEPPKPYTPVKATTKEFGCLGRKTDLGSFLLPTQIMAADKPLLAAPIRMFSEPDIFVGMKGKAKVVERSGDSARWKWE